MAKVAEFLAEDDDGLVVTEEPEKFEVTYTEPTQIVTPTTKNARVKGTWVMHWGPDKFNFVDGRRYDLPKDLFEYLRRRGNIYDTL